MFAMLFGNVILLHAVTYDVCTGQTFRGAIPQTDVIHGS